MSEQALDHELDKLSEDEEIEQYVKANLKELAKVRIELETWKSEFEATKRMLEVTPLQIRANEILIEIKTLKQSEENLKEYVAKDALRLFEFTNFKDRTPVSCVQIKEFTVVTILDEKKAKIWAANDAPSVLSISKSKFDKAMKVLEKDFVEIKKVYRAQVSSNLSEYLDEN